MHAEKKKRLILHIGTTKTGSSALQHFFVRNRKLLEAQSVLYYQPSQRYLPWQGQSNGDFLLQAEIKSDQSLIRHELQRFADISHQYETIILSEECFWCQGILIPSFWQHLKNQLRTVLGDSVKIEVIVYLRRQDDWLFSQWKQSVRGLRSDDRTFSEYSEWCREQGLLDYNSALLKIEENFEHCNTIVRCYDRMSFTGGSILSDFLNAASLSFQRKELAYNSIVNTSFSISLTEAIRLINAGEIPCMASQQALFKAASILAQQEVNRKEEYPLTENERTDFLERVQKDNLLLSNRHKGLEPLLNCSFPPYKVYQNDEARNRSNAIALSKLAEHIEKRRKNG